MPDDHAIDNAMARAAVIFQANANASETEIRPGLLAENLSPESKPQDIRLTPLLLSFDLR
jgi:hypothetical protein